MSSTQGKPVPVRIVSLTASNSRRTQEIGESVADRGYTVELVIWKGSFLLPGESMVALLQPVV